MSATNLIDLQAIDLDSLEQAAHAATAGRWINGHPVWRAHVLEERYGKGKCAWCDLPEFPLHSFELEVEPFREWHNHLGEVLPNSAGREIIAVSGDEITDVVGVRKNRWGIHNKADVEFMTAADPQTVLALIAEIRALRGDAFTPAMVTAPRAAEVGRGAEEVDDAAAIAIELDEAQLAMAVLMECQEGSTPVTVGMDVNSLEQIVRGLVWHFSLAMGIAGRMYEVEPGLVFQQHGSVFREALATSMWATPDE